MNPMNPIPINEAEAIVAALFDSGLTDYDKFTLEELDSTGGSFGPSWDSSLLRTRATRFQLRWRKQVNTGDYDRVRLFINYPPHVRLTMTAMIGGIKHELIQGMPGQKLPFEPTSEPISSPEGAGEIEELNFAFESSQAGETLISFYWIGMVNSVREPLIEESLPKYSPLSWEGLLNLAGHSGLNMPLFASTQPLIDCKSKARTPMFKPLMEKLERAAKEWETYQPEPDIRQFVPCTEHLYRYVRIRDRNRPFWEEQVQLLALAGYLCEREDWSRLAARLVLSIIHTPKWFEGPQGCFPGSGWHHVCFMEAHYSSALCFALQFIGDLLTPRAKTLVLDRIEEAWTMVNARCEEPGYRWYMNQGLVFNSDRLLAAMTLSRYGRSEKYARNVEQSYRDHTTILHNYLAEDGHCSEGGYYSYSFGTSLRLWLAYAEFSGKTVAEIVPHRFVKSTDFVDASTSSVNDLGYMLPLGAGTFRPWPSYLVAFLAAHCGWAHGWAVLQNRMQQAGESDPVSGIDALVMLLSTPSEIPAGGKASSGVRGCPKSGLVAYGFPAPYRGKLLIQCERPASGHHHEDRGSVVLEAYGEVLLPDLGTLNYSHLQCAFMKYPDWHNLAAPVGLSMQIIETRQSSDPHPLLEQAEEVDGVFRFAMNLAPIYGAEVRVGRREGELSVGPFGGCLLLCDQWKFLSPRSVELTFQSFSPWQITGGTAVSVVGAVELTIAFRETGKAHLQVTQCDDRIDCLERQVYTLSIKTSATTETELLSSVSFKVQPDTPDIERQTAPDNMGSARLPRH